MNAVTLRHYVVRYEHIEARAVIENHVQQLSIRDYLIIHKC